MKKHQHTSTEGKEGKQLNYEASISCYNNAYATFEFYAESAELAKSHVEHIVNNNLLEGFDWNKEPFLIHYISYRKKGNKKHIYVYTNAQWQKSPPDKTIPEYYKENAILKAEVERLKANKETAMLLALEFGFKQCEKGENLNGAFLNYNKLTQQ